MIQVDESKIAACNAVDAQHTHPDRQKSGNTNLLVGKAQQGLAIYHL